MFDRQADELRELMKNEEQRQLKEVYDELDQEQKAKEQELESLRTEQKHISILLDSYGVPRKTNGKYLSILERLDIALKTRSVA